MLSGVRTIFFSTDLQIPPTPEFEIKKIQVRDLYSKLNEPDGYPYENLDLQANPPTLSTRREGGYSRCQVGNGKIRIEEDSPASIGMGIDEFVQAVRTVLTRLGPSVGPFIVQRCIIRCTAQPNNHADALELLAGKVADAMETIDAFARPPSFFGIRFRFAPATITSDETADAAHAEGSGETAEPIEKPTPARGKKKSKKNSAIIHRGFLTLRYETYSKDIKQVWMEVDANYVEEVIEVSNLDLIERNIRDTCKFAMENAKRFLDQFDIKDDEK